MMLSGVTSKSNKYTAVSNTWNMKQYKENSLPPIVNYILLTIEPIKISQEQGVESSAKGKT